MPSASSSAAAFSAAAGAAPLSSPARRLKWLGLGLRASSQHHLVASHVVAPPADAPSSSTASAGGGGIFAAAAPAAEAAGEFEEVVREIFGSAGWESVVADKRRRLQLASGGSLYCIELDEAGRAFVAVTSSDFPTRYVFGSDSGVATNSPRLMQEFRAFVLALPAASGGGAAPEAAALGPSSHEARQLKKALKKFLKELGAKFDDLEALDKLAAVRRKVADVQRVMGENIAKASENDSLLSELDHKAALLETSAQTLFKGATRLRRHACRSKWTSYAAIAAAVLAIAAAIVLSLNYGTFHWWQ